MVTGLFTLPAQRATAAAKDCISGLGLSATTVTTSDGVTETILSGTIPSWDGVPLDVDVTLPGTGVCHVPLVAFGHGWGNSKTDWESPTVSSSDVNHSGWNNTSFAARGYAVLTFSNRGWHGSCGPQASADGTPAGLPAACTANGRQYWIHLSDLRYEIRDTQWLIGRLVDEGVADPGRIGVTGGSLGGGTAWLTALANDRTMCGGQGWAWPQPDPCAGVADGGLVPWRSPAGQRLRVKAAVPEYTWASLTSALLPNGRASDNAPAAPASGDLRNPVGIPIESYIDGLFAKGQPLGNGFYQPPTSTDDTADLPAWYALIQAGPNTVDTSDGSPYAAQVDHALTELSNFKSPLSPLLPVDADVPVFQMQGFTDPLFKPVEAALIRAKMTAFDPAYPIATEYGDVGHSYADNDKDAWAHFNARANAFFDYELKGVGTAPVFDVEASLTRCRDSAAPFTVASGASLPALASTRVTFTSAVSGSTSSAATGPESVQTDPIANSGCRTMTAATDPGVASWTFAPGGAQTLLGAPVVAATVTPTGPDSEVIARLWDVDPVGGRQYLVSRGDYRLAATPLTSPSARFELSANGWALPAGDVWKLEIAGADTPTFQADTVASTMTIGPVSLTLPLR